MPSSGGGKLLPSRREWLLARERFRAVRGSRQWVGLVVEARCPFFGVLHMLWRRPPCCQVSVVPFEMGRCVLFEAVYPFWSWFQANAKAMISGCPIFYLRPVRTRQAARSFHVEILNQSATRLEENQINLLG